MSLRHSSLQEILVSRGDRYGEFASQAKISQGLKCILFNSREVEMEPDQLEALDMIAHKLARIVNGDPNYADSWIDIAGYAQLVADRLNGRSS
jgi:hypothetical protein